MTQFKEKSRISMERNGILPCKPVYQTGLVPKRLGWRNISANASIANVINTGVPEEIAASCPC
ncbi:MAG: hypothetical protein ACR5LD_08925 [Symbiopectobacterium sp.]